MKLFLLFLFVSFMLGIILEKATTERRRWVMTGSVLLLTMTYFFFDRFI